MRTLLDHWPLVEVDFQEVYGIDLGERGLLRTRSWRWFMLRAFALLSSESRVQRVLAPAKPPEQPQRRGD